MYYLAIVSQDDLVRGRIAPSYILCQSQGKSENRAPWRVCRANSQMASVPKVLVKSVFDQDIMIDFLSSYRTRDHGHNSNKYEYEQTKKYYPKGALFWFECNEYGEKTGPAVFEKIVPDKIRGKIDSGKHRLEEALARKPTTQELLSKPFWTIPLKTSGIKPQMYQKID